MRQLVISFFLAATLFLPHALCTAEEAVSEENSEEAVQPDIKYYQITPNIMTFYQNSGRKLGYIVVQVQLVVKGQENYDLVEENLPLVQDSLIDFFNRQDKATVQDLKQRENLRSQAKERVAMVLKQELGKDIIDNLLFTQYVFQ